MRTSLAGHWLAETTADGRQAGSCSHSADWPAGVVVVVVGDWDWWVRYDCLRDGSVKPAPFNTSVTA